MGKIREEMEKVARENAIKDLKKLQIDIGSSPDDLEKSPLYYALDIAIKTLEQQPSDDCVSREEIRNIIIKDNETYGYSDRTHNLMNEILGLSPVKPQPFINKPCISEGVCREDKIQVLDKIRAEIERKANSGQWSEAVVYGMKKSIVIIDKYKAESEDKR